MSVIAPTIPYNAGHPSIKLLWLTLHEQQYYHRTTVFYSHGHLCPLKQHRDGYTRFMGSKGEHIGVVHTANPSVNQETIVADFDVFGKISIQDNAVLDLTQDFMTHWFEDAINSDNITHLKHK